MIDRLYLFALFALSFFLNIYLATAGYMALLLVALLVMIPLFIFEGLANYLSPGLQRDLITWRYKPKRGLPRLVRRLQLDRPHSRDVLREKAILLGKAAQAVTMRHPNPIYGPVNADRLARDLTAVLPAQNQEFGRLLRLNWTNPAPGLTTLGGWILLIRHGIGRIFFPRVGPALDQQADSMLLNSDTFRRPPADQPWETAHYPAAVLHEVRSSVAGRAGFGSLFVQSTLLPLGSQRLLQSVSLALSGNRLKGLIGKLLSPSHSALLTEVSRHVPAWHDWTTERKQEAAVVAAAQTERDRYRQPDSLSAEEVAALVDATAQDSILLNRLWPPGSAATTNSWLGGLPCLPNGTDWPRNPKSGLPLHFLAQVDCADLPTLGGTSPLPRDGLLLFFSDLDEERVDETDDEGAGQGNGMRNAVVYVPKSRQNVPPRALPDDLPEIDHTNGKPSARSDGRRAYPKWPVVPTVVKVWGEGNPHDPRTANRDYIRQSVAAHDASLAAAMPERAPRTRSDRLFSAVWRFDDERKPVKDATGRHLFDIAAHPEAVPSGFPWCGAGIAAFHDRLQQSARNAARDVELDRRFLDAPWRKNDTAEARDKRVQEIERKAAKAAALDQLVKAAQGVLGSLPRLDPVPAETTERFRAWLGTVARETPDLCHHVERAVAESMLALCQTAITDPQLFPLLPGTLFTTLADRLTPNPGQSQHLMLGPAQRKTNSTAGFGVRLLCLDSDYGVGMMYCDCGVLEYWIKPEDLAALRFDRAVAYTAGG